MNNQKQTIIYIVGSIIGIMLMNELFPYNKLTILFMGLLGSFIGTSVQILPFILGCLFLIKMLKKDGILPQ